MIFVRIFHFLNSSHILSTGKMQLPVYIFLTFVLRTAWTEDCSCDDLKAQMSALARRVDRISGNRVTNGTCPNYWKKYGRSCYLFTSNWMTFVEAEEFCEELGGRLVHVNSYWENVFLKGYLEDMNAGNTWMGLTDIESERVWTWYGTDRLPSYTDWSSGEPDNYNNEDCAQFWASDRYRWNDHICSNKFNVLCEIEN